MFIITFLYCILFLILPRLFIKPIGSSRVSRSILSLDYCGCEVLHVHPSFVCVSSGFLGFTFTLTHLTDAQAYLNNLRHDTPVTPGRQWCRDLDSQLNFYTGLSVCQYVPGGMNNVPWTPFSWTSTLCTPGAMYHLSMTMATNGVSWLNCSVVCPSYTEM